MRKETILLWKEKEYTYEGAFGFVPNLTTYLHEEDNNIRPCIIVVPGGGYRVVSPTEGEIVALEFYRRGYNVFVCTYTVNPLLLVPLKMQPMMDLSRAVRLVRKRAAEFLISPDRIFVCGFSAGGHLSASLCVHYQDIEDGVYGDVSNRPDGAILSYPVITSGSRAHRGSFEALLGRKASEKELSYMSLEYHVTAQTPPCFLWQTATDETVPVENSYLFAKALKKNGIPFAHHIFTEGSHGLSLANQDWAEGRFGEPCTLQQIFAVEEHYKAENLKQPSGLSEFLAMASMEAPEGDSDRIPNEEAAVWVELADRWLKNFHS